MLIQRGDQYHIAIFRDQPIYPRLHNPNLTGEPSLGALCLYARRHKSARRHLEIIGPEGAIETRG
jgi:hypothetical protein